MINEERTWWKEGVVYQIYPRSFCDGNNDGIGDLNGICGKLDYLVTLGVDIIWMCPIFKSPNDDNGYDISDYRAIMDEFGTLADFDELLAQAHKRKIRIVLDLVANHTSDEHVWFAESRKSRDNPFRDYYIWRSGKTPGDPAEGGEPPNNWGAVFGGSAWQYDKLTGMYYLHLFSRKQPDLNWENEEVRSQVYDMMTWWGNKGIDGFRMDVITMISKDQRFPDGRTDPSVPEQYRYGEFAPFAANGPRVHEFLREMNRRVISKFDWMTVGEGANSELDNALEYTGFDRHELNMLFMFEHVNLGKPCRASNWKAAPLDLVALKQIFAKWQNGLEGKGWNTLYWENHDQVRSVSRFGNDSSEYRVVSAKMLALCLLFMKGTPYVYQGEELGMVNAHFASVDDYRDLASYNDYNEMIRSGLSPQEALDTLRMISRDNARTPMQWDDSPNAGFTRGRPWIKVNPSYKEINAASQITDPDSVFNFYKQVIHIRHTNLTVVYGRFELLMPDSTELFVYTRTLDNSSILTICNFTNKPAAVSIPAEFMTGRILVSNYAGSRPDAKTVRPYESFAVEVIR
jgi:oligo-1,6-glucosidase